jgi:hypothetical protein
MMVDKLMSQVLDLHTVSSESVYNVYCLGLIDVANEYMCDGFKLDLYGCFNAFYPRLVEKEIYYYGQEDFMVQHYRPLADMSGDHYPPELYPTFAAVYLALAQAEKPVELLTGEVEANASLSFFLVKSFREKLVSVTKAAKLVTKQLSSAEDPASTAAKD